MLLSRQQERDWLEEESTSCPPPALRPPSAAIPSTSEVSQQPPLHQPQHASSYRPSPTMFRAPSLARTRPVRLKPVTKPSPIPSARSLTTATRRRPPQLPQQPVHPPSSPRRLHLAPPFLLDDYIPRYLLLDERSAAKKRAAAYAHLSKCNLCPRKCNVNRWETTGICLIGAEAVKVNTIAPHFGEEPCLQGHNGSGSVFFSGCNLRCVFCQNHDIAHQRNGFDLTPEELAEWYLKLQTVGRCHNVNLVTPEHVVPQVVLSILAAREMGLRIPIVYNTSAFDSPESIHLLDGLVDIYLPDFKVWKGTTSKRLLKADGYAEAAMESVKLMHEQVGDLCFTADGIAKSGVLVRHLVMPGKEDEGVEIMKWLAENVSKDLFVHVMEQYFPRAHVGRPKRGGKKEGAEEVDDEVTEPDGVKADKKRSETVRYKDINRAVKDEEVSVVKKAAREAGLWRFVEAAEHGGFNI